MNVRSLSVILLAILITACISQPPEETLSPTEPPETELPETELPETPQETPPETDPQRADKIDLWNMKTGPHLRGANIYQRRVYLELDGREYKGPGPVGAPFTQEDFDRLAALGCNYVNISHPGLFTETPPYRLDKDIQDNLDNLLAMIENADMFAVISFRTGPGRSEFTFMLEETGDWFDESYLNDSVWQDREAQDAWVAMWAYTANRYKDNPIVAGYDLMVEPNSSETGSDYIDDYLGIWDPEEFYDTYGGTLYDWNQFYPRIVNAVRDVDRETPILIGGNAYSRVRWLPYMKVLEDQRIVYTVHQYEPSKYTQQWLDSKDCTYPGRCDVDWDGEKEQFDRAWLEDLLATVDRFAAKYGVPVAVNEFGLVRWVPGAAEFMDDEMGLFEEKGMNNALWEWEPGWDAQIGDWNAYNFLYGPDPHNSTIVDNKLQQVIKKYWSHNSVRPSTFYCSASTPVLDKLSILSSQKRLTHVTYWFYILPLIALLFPTGSKANNIPALPAGSGLCPQDNGFQSHIGLI